MSARSGYDLWALRRMNGTGSDVARRNEEFMRDGAGSGLRSLAGLLGLSNRPSRAGRLAPAKLVPPPQCTRESVRAGG
jgi:hypothetical protein